MAKDKIKLRGLNGKHLDDISREMTLSLSTEEMIAIKKYFASKRRDPSLMELEIIAQTWSEHCKHKTMTGIIEYRTRSENGKWETQVIDNLLKETIFAVTEKLNAAYCLSVFEDNAGIIEWNENYGIAAKVETHNHPSAIEPYGGAETGIGGVIRDILGCGKGAFPVLNFDVFCFAPPDTSYGKVTEGILHPRRILRGVVSGVRDYGNRMGIPTSAGAIVFSDDFLFNPLVFCGTVGIIPKKFVSKKVRQGDLIILIGGKTGRDGIHGATFSSIGLKKETSAGCVQIGDPIAEKKFADVLIKARDRNLFNSITDCGAGGLSSAVGELGKKLGARVFLEKVPLKHAGLKPWEIFLSESQERMVLSVPPSKFPELKTLFQREDVEASFIGEFVPTKKLEVFHRRKKIASLDMEFLHNGFPRSRR
ncbi:MAG: phosphoribosylformylglycinamidine synthase, partial [Elusimicrobia bacterium]|nr:phosphoribosylformylglycinamidine synthase [Elusimicrobiota bacterium]